MIPFALLAAAWPVQQPSLADAVRQAIGNCRVAEAGTILVCGRRESPCRLPPELRDPGFDVNGPVDSVARERHKLMEAGASGTGSCSNVGAGGWTGCMVKGWNEADQQRGFRPAGQLKK